MANFATFQKTAANPDPWQAGVPTGPMLPGYAIGAQVATAVYVAQPCFYLGVNTNGPSTVVSFVKGPNDSFAGVVMRSNANAMAFSDTIAGYSMTIPDGQGCEVQIQGSVPVPIAVANEGASPLVGSYVYATDAGAWQTQTPSGTAPTNSTLTRFRVSAVKPGWTAGGLVEISTLSPAA